MSSITVYDAFEQRLREEWTASTLVFENEPFQELVEAGLPFVYVEIFGDRLEQESFGAPGANVWIEEGRALLHVMQKSGQGSRQARQWATDLSNLFRERPLLLNALTGWSVITPTMSIGAGEPGVDVPNYWGLALEIDWRIRDTTTAVSP